VERNSATELSFELCWRLLWSSRRERELKSFSTFRREIISKNVISEIVSADGLTASKGLTDREIYEVTIS
jgi:hypothetical protein